MTTTLADIDLAQSKAPHPRLVEEINWQNGGIDPLGLRQINLDLMDSMLPGINNVTMRIRPYTLMSWAWWKAAQAAGIKGQTSAERSKLQDLVDRLEVLFVWSHFLAEDNPGLPGRDKIGGELGYTDKSPAYAFDDDRWRVFQNKRSSTSLLAATQYGPSLRALNWLRSEQGAYHPSLGAMPAVEALDAAVAAHLPNGFLSSSPKAVEPETAAALHKRWELASPTGC